MSVLVIVWFKERVNLNHNILFTDLDFLKIQ
jgi:hypothetical protein